MSQALTGSGGLLAVFVLAHSTVTGVPASVLTWLLPERVCVQTSFFFLKIFMMWTIFKVFIEFVTILLLFYVLVFWPGGMWDLSSPTRDRTHTPCMGRRSLNHWTTREVPKRSFL